MKLFESLVDDVRCCAIIALMWCPRTVLAWFPYKWLWFVGCGFCCFRRISAGMCWILMKAVTRLFGFDWVLRVLFAFVLLACRVVCAELLPSFIIVLFRGYYDCLFSSDVGM